MTLRIEINPEQLSWAINRSRRGKDYFRNKFPKLEQWLTGELKPTLKQLDNLATTAYTSVGFLLMDSIPEQKLTLPDFRSIGNRGILDPSPNLLDTLHICEARQTWFEEYSLTNRMGALPFVASANIKDKPENVASAIRELIGINTEQRASFGTWGEALSHFYRSVDDKGITTICNGIVGNNTWRKLDPQEFRGFAIVSTHAPLIFVNGADSKSAQMFTLAHELAHIWIGESGVSDNSIADTPDNEIEKWCDKVAAEILVPMRSLNSQIRDEQFYSDDIKRLARYFKVSSLVILRRLWDGGYIDQQHFRDLYDQEVKRISESSNSSSGGNFYLSQPYKIGRSFAQAVIISALEGNTLLRDAKSMLGVKKTSTFNELARQLGVAA